jgi:hypothetical protein
VYGSKFSSCNQANYAQGADNTQLTWCGVCSKCANSYLLFAPYVNPTELKQRFKGTDLFAVTSLYDTFKGLLGIDGFMKPFECIGEIDELRYAYHEAVRSNGYVKLPFDVPESSFDLYKEYDMQPGLRKFADITHIDSV